MSGDRGAGALEYLGIVALVAGVASAIALTPVSGDIARETEYQVCKVVHAAGQREACEKASASEPTAKPTAQPAPTPTLGPTAGPSSSPSAAPSPTSTTTPGPVPQPVAVDPDMPQGTCLTSIENDYIEPGLAAGIKKADILQDGGSQVTLRHYSTKDEKDSWEVWDTAWSDAGAGISPGSNGGWLALQGATTEVYKFTDLKQAEEFHKNLRDYRLQDPFKVALRTLPGPGSITWALEKLPFVGDDFEKFIGSKEPDRTPHHEVRDGGLWAGFFNDEGVGDLSLVGRDWATASGGLWTENDTGDKNYKGETTEYLQGSNQIMESAEVSVDFFIKKLGLGTNRADVEKAIDALEAELGTRAGNPKLPDGLRKALREDTRAGIGLRTTDARWYGATKDKNGNYKELSQIDDRQLSWHLRADTKWGPVAWWIQNSQQGARTRTNKTLDLTKPEEKKAFDILWPPTSPAGFINNVGVLDALFDQGLGTMSRVNYDYSVKTEIPSFSLEAKIPFTNIKLRALNASVEFESNKSRVTKGEYFKPGVGWVPWRTCGR